MIKHGDCCWSGDDFKCLNCNSELDLAPAHYESRGSGGSDDLDNLMLLCWRCHRAAHDGKLKIIRVNKHFFFRKVK